MKTKTSEIKIKTISIKATDMGRKPPKTNSNYVWVMEGLKARGRKNTEMLNLLQFDWPASTGVLEKICDHISDYVNKDEEPIIYEIIESALSKYQDAIHNRGENKTPDPIRFGIFIEALITSTSSFIEVQDDSGNVWSRKSASSFAEWYQLHVGTINLKPAPSEQEKSIRVAIYQLITSERVREILRKVDYEKTIMAGSVGASS